jgi:hexosaminidase
LTDDQGWRIEIKKYPELQRTASCRKETLIGHYNDMPHRFDGKKYCGFYTQREIKDIVEYAKKRFVTIIPEIEMPGHCAGRTLGLSRTWMYWWTVRGRDGMGRISTMFFAQGMTKRFAFLDDVIGRSGVSCSPAATSTSVAMNVQKRAGKPVQNAKNG